MRGFEKAIGVVTISAALCGCLETEPEVVTWKLQSHAVSTSVDYRELERMAENVRVMSQDRFIIEPHAGGELAHGPGIFDAVRDGTVQMGNGWPNWWSGQHPAWAVMNAGPFDFMNLDASMMFFLAGEGTAMANELAGPLGVVWRPAWWPGMEFGLLSRVPVRGLDDLDGLKVRIGPGLPSEVLAEASGSYAIPLVPEEIRPALERGDLDAVEWTTTNGAWELGLHDISPYAIVPAIWQPSVLADFLINKPAYESLPEDLRAILETAIKAYTLTTTMKAKVKDIEALERFKAQGTELSVWSADDIARWRKASDKVLANYVERDDFTRRVVESKLRFKARFDAYNELFGAYDK